MNPAPAPAISPELRGLLRRLKLGKALDTLPERLALAKHNKLDHASFLEPVLADEPTGATTRPAASSASTCSRSMTSPCTRWTPPPPATSTRSPSNATAS